MQVEVHKYQAVIHTQTQPQIHHWKELLYSHSQLIDNALLRILLYGKWWELQQEHEAQEIAHSWH